MQGGATTKTNNLHFERTSGYINKTTSESEVCEHASAKAFLLLQPLPAR